MPSRVPTPSRCCSPTSRSRAAKYSRCARTCAGVTGAMRARFRAQKSR
ncbi:hypothetical protein JOF53_002128 [Crossiella equi]|uniref:Uncharacterized protein n=1 Tax=Crossiella equi TaxID=130796 RepID=A0ABS5AAC3_9PSEU|nr:hypothetical protein [Crossiella equi]MBP2473256.1 hypothetical protein [Crossiella equi]